MQPTASKSTLLLQCSYPYDPSLTWERGETSSHALYGTAFHLHLGNMLALPAGTTNTNNIPDELRTHVTTSYHYLIEWLEKNGYSRVRGTWYVEQSFAWRPGSGRARRIANPNADHVYEELQPGEIAGTVDLMVVPDDTDAPILVLDHKTGTAGNFHNPERLEQLLTLGAIGMAFTSRPSFIPAIHHTPAAGTPVCYEGPTMMWQDLAIYASQLNAQMGRIGDGSMRPGPECGRCPARAVCPAKSAELLAKSESLFTQALAVTRQWDEETALTREMKMGKLHQLIAMFRELDARATEEIKREMEANPDFEPRRPDGKRLILEERTAERLSKASIIEALGKVEGAAKIEELRQLGCVGETVSRSLRAK